MAGHRDRCPPGGRRPSAPGCSRRTSVRVRRSRAGSKSSRRPAAWMGWKVTPRTQGCCSAKSTIRPISPSLSPFFRVTTSVVEMFSSFSRSIARRRTSRRSAPRRSSSAAALEGVELQIDLEAGAVLGQAPGEVRLAGDAHAVGVDHQVLDRAPPGQVEHLEELGMDGGLAAGDLDDVRLDLVAHHGVEHALDLVQGPEGRPGPLAGVADRAAQVAGVGDLHERRRRSAARGRGRGRSRRGSPSGSACCRPPASRGA